MDILDFSYNQKHVIRFGVESLVDFFFIYFGTDQSQVGRYLLENSKGKPPGLIMNEFLKFNAVFHPFD
jgi:hypothetical protein